MVQTDWGLGFKEPVFIVQKVTSGLLSCRRNPVAFVPKKSLDNNVTFDSSLLSDDVLRGRRKRQHCQTHCGQRGPALIRISFSKAGLCCGNVVPSSGMVYRQCGTNACEILTSP